MPSEYVDTHGYDYGACTDYTEHQDVTELVDETPRRYVCHICGTEWTEPDQDTP